MEVVALYCDAVHNGRSNSYVAITGENKYLLSPNDPYAGRASMKQKTDATHTTLQSSIHFHLPGREFSATTEWELEYFHGRLEDERVAAEANDAPGRSMNWEQLGTNQATTNEFWCDIV